MKEFMLLIRNEKDHQVGWSAKTHQQFLKACEYYIDDLKKRLARFCADFGERKIAEITVEHLDNWLRALPGSPKSRANYRANVGVLFS